jgi:hypothetical protein
MADTKNQRVEKAQEATLSINEPEISIMTFEPDTRLLDAHIPPVPQLMDDLGPQK